MTQRVRYGILAALLWANAWAQAKPAFVSLKESLQEKVVCDGPCAETFSGAFTFKFRRAISPNLAESFNADTEFVVRAQNFLIVRRLGDDPDYAPGDESAVFVNIHQSGTKALIMKVAWKGSELTVTIKGKTPDEQSPGAESLRDAPVGGHFAHAIDLLIRINQGSMAVWEVNYEDTEMEAFIKPRTKIVRGTSFDLRKITIKGSMLLEE